MARGQEPEELIGPREVFERHEPKAQGSSRSKEPRNQKKEDRTRDAGSQPSSVASRSPELRKVYEIRGRTYRLRTSEIASMVAIGKFRVIAQEDLAEFAYVGDKEGMRPDVENLVRQGLVQMKSIPHEERGSRHLLALTKPGLGLLTEHGFAGNDQALYFGFVKAREADHDADLYRLYQKAADKIAGAGGRNLRVVLNYELKSHVYQDLAKLGPDRATSAVAAEHGLQVVRGKIPFPDVRIEYDTPDGERARADLELATCHYRIGNLAEKVRAGFSLYARSSEVSNLQRILDQHELTAEISSL